MLPIWLMVRGGGAMTRNHKKARRYEAGRMGSAARYEAGLADEAPLCGMKRSILLRQGFGGQVGS